MTGTTHGAIVVHVQVLKGLHEAARHVASLRCLDGSVHQALTPPHGVEEELGGTEAAVEGGRHKALGLGRLVTSPEVRQRSVLQPVCISDVLICFVFVRQPETQTTMFRLWPEVIPCRSLMWQCIGKET